MLNSLRKKISNLIYKENNRLSTDFLRNGNKKMNANWSQVVMTDEDFYSGYSYASIRVRANAVAQNSVNVITKSDKKDEVHPYLQLIESSPSFSEYQFWSDISTYLDLEGVYYLMAIRNREGQRYGNVVEFKMLNPYNVRPVLKLDQGTGVYNVEGYIETRNGYQREIPPEMIIMIKELNPFNPDKNFSMTDAAKESQFTLKTAGDYTRHTLQGNINAPGIISTGIILPPKEFENFKSRITNHTKGEPLFANGSGVLDYKAMTADLKNSDLKGVEEINRDVLFADAGVSKTLLGIEQSGTTRETSKTQVQLFLNNHIMPRIQLIADSLNQDYKNTYGQSNKFNKVEIIVNNPTSTDHEADKQKAEALEKDFELFNSLIEKGYSSDIASAYVNGQIGLEDLGEPKKIEPVVEKPKEENKIETCDHDHVNNEFSDDQKGLVSGQQGSLQNAIINIDQKIVAYSIEAIGKKFNTIEDQEDVIGKRDKKALINELEAVLIGFYGIIMTFEASKIMRKRISQFNLPGSFRLDRISKQNINDLADDVARSHVNTILDDVLVTAREEALQGASLADITRSIKAKYNKTISTTRAKTIARTETNRAFTQSQYEADRQFIKQNNLESRAYKTWQTRSDNPCDFCLDLERKGPIPFATNFADKGDTLTVDGKTLDINFSELKAGNAHPNCGCIYELTIETVENQLAKEKVELERIINKNKEQEEEIENKKDDIEELMSEIEGIL